MFGHLQGVILMFGYLVILNHCIIVSLLCINEILIYILCWYVNLTQIWNSVNWVITVCTLKININFDQCYTIDIQMFNQYAQSSNINLYLQVIIRD